MLLSSRSFRIVHFHAHHCRVGFPPSVTSLGTLLADTVELATHSVLIMYFRDDRVAALRYKVRLLYYLEYTSFV